MPPGAVLWVPYGFLPVPLYVPSDGEEKEKDKGDVNFLWVIPLYNVELAKTVPAKAWGAIVSFNEQHHKKNGGQEMWKTRGELFEQFCEEMRR